MARLRSVCIVATFACLLAFWFAPLPDGAKVASLIVSIFLFGVYMGATETNGGM